MTCWKCWKTWLKAAGIRAVKTVAQTAGFGTMSFQMVPLRFPSSGADQFHLQFRRLATSAQSPGLKKQTMWYDNKHSAFSALLFIDERKFMSRKLQVSNLQLQFANEML